MKETLVRVSLPALGLIIAVTLAALLQKRQNSVPPSSKKGASPTEGVYVKAADTGQATDAVQYLGIQKQPRSEFQPMGIQYLEKKYVGLRDSTGEISETRLQMLEEGTCSYHSLYDRETRVLEINKFGAPMDLPKVELRFFAPAPENGTRPHPVGAMVVYPIIDGKAEEERIMEFGGFDCGAADAFESVLASRILMSDDAERGDYQSLVFKQGYYIEFYRPGHVGENKVPELLGSAIINMPANVPRRSLAVMNIDVTQKVPRPGKYSMPLKTLRIEIREDYLKPDMVARFYDPVSKNVREKEIGKSGRVELKAKGLGGDLAIMRRAHTDGDRGFSVAYTKTVDHEAIVIPDDADILLSPRDVVRFHLTLNRARFPRHTEVVLLLPHKSSHVDMAFCEIIGDKLPASIQFSCAPGRYYVAAISPTSQEPVLVGKIEISPTDKNGVLDILPLTN